VAGTDQQKLKEAGKAIEVVWFGGGHISAVLQSELCKTKQSK